MPVRTEIRYSDGRGTVTDQQLREDWNHYKAHSADDRSYEDYIREEILYGNLRRVWDKSKPPVRK